MKRHTQVFFSSFQEGEPRKGLSFHLVSVIVRIISLSLTILMTIEKANKQGLYKEECLSNLVHADESNHLISKQLLSPQDVTPLYKRFYPFLYRLGLGLGVGVRV